MVMMSMAVLHEAAAARLEELADAVDEIPTALLLEYAQALEFEQAQDGPDRVHCSMTLEIGFALNPQSIEDVCKIYVRAIELTRHDPRFADGLRSWLPGTGDDDMADFWLEFKHAGNA
jgi:hypothetical protein